MSGVQTITVDPAESEIRLDRWFKRHFPELGHGRLEKLLRTGQVRVDGKRATAGQRVGTGQVIRVPPLGEPPAAEAGVPQSRPVPARDAEMLRALVLHRDRHLIVLNKPSGLAVQGGTGTRRHIDGMLEALQFDAAERPRLVHRLDRDTSGVFVVARTAAAARFLGDAFRDKTVRKVYWALVVGQPKPRRGKIDSPIAKRGTARGERVVEDEDEGQRAVTWYATVESAARQASWLALMPVTGRTHQLRVHCGSVLRTPILGDGKYGGAAAFLADLDPKAPLHLHARSIRLPHPDGGTLTIAAPLPPHMQESWAYFGFGEEDGDPFAELET